MKIALTHILLIFITPRLCEKIYIAQPDINSWLKSGLCQPSWGIRSGQWKTCLPTDDSTREECVLTTGDWSFSGVNKILIEVETTTATCFGSNKTYPICRNNFTMGVFSNNGAKLAEPSFIPSAIVPRQDFFTSSDQFAVNNMTGVKGIKLQFLTNRYCGAIDKVQVYYYKCPTATGDLVNFPASTAPDSIEKTKTINGKCTDGAQPTGERASFMQCKDDGTFSVHGRCVCKDGYTKDGTSCRACSTGEYKPTAGNEACLKCGANSKIGTVPRTRCECKENYFRMIGKTELNDADCYAPPGPPTNVLIDNIAAHEATISWTPSTKGSSDSGVYVVMCTPYNCPDDSTYFPKNTSEPKIELKDLGAYANYEIKITKLNNITTITGKEFSVTKKFTTQKGAPGKIRNPIHSVNTDDGSVVFVWEPPFAQGSPNPVYVVSYGDETFKLTTRTFKIKSDTQDKEYVVKIYTEVNVDGKFLSGPVYETRVKVKGGIPLSLALGVAFGLITFIVIILISAFCFWKRRNPAYLQVVRMEDGTVKLPSSFYTGGKIYVDPKSYNDVEEAVNEFAFEIDRNNLKMHEKIGDGEFADVHRGELFRGGKHQTVAVKTLKPGATKQDRDDFISEAAILGQFSDPNVILLEGVIVEDQPNAIILEFMAHGALDKYLQENDMQFEIPELLEMARGIASGMKYLSELGFIHRDLAARNILVNEKRVCKIADFGMSLEIRMDDGETKGGKIPVRWTAPEAIQFKKFTTASDVWSYGVVVWEIMSYGERPYWEWSNYEVLEQVNRGYRLPPPMGCPRVVHDLMLQCWNRDRTKRPLFSFIRDRIESWLDNTALLDDLAPITKLDDNLDYTIMQTINKWLQAIGMGRYANNFLEQGFATPRQILLLTIDDLEKLGVGPVEHQKRIMKAIENTRAQVEAQIGKGGSVIKNDNAKDIRPHNI
ncbi:ephrin type-B receptor 1-B-like [Hydractinia symbiolongicarpus]|uniref:ephrin type-B receptor 1-B-like n=1 Tax=Hydractinia symbiolongicarpus TaxID=13093 RepID=UPI00255080B5|nr:ephrin type-B receptor 1-B-like [Hydractinia symbiolongicarpus]